MRSEALDISIVNRGGALRISLGGPFHDEQVTGFKEKICGLIDDGNHHIVIDMENVTLMGDSVALMFLSLVNIIQGKKGAIKFIFRNDVVSKSLAAYRNIFNIYPDDLALKTGGFFGILKYRRRILARKTGIRLSKPIALVLLFTLAGWFISLFFIIYMQNQRIRQQEHELSELVQWNRKAAADINNLREKIKPMQQLGILKDTLEN
jgi:anti-anti-sigma regulatory factor/cell division protein FtsB